MAAIDNLSIISFNGSKRRLLKLPHTSLQGLFKKEEPDICFLPGDGEQARLKVIKGYDEFTIPNGDSTVLLYDSNRVKMQAQTVNLNSFGQIPGVDLDRMVVPQVEISTLQPYKQIVKEFSMVSWKYDFFHENKLDAETKVEGIISFSQRLAATTRKPVLIGGEMNIDCNVLEKIVRKMSDERQKEFLSELQPEMSEQCYTPEMTKYAWKDFRHLFMMTVFLFKCKSAKRAFKTSGDRGSPGSASDCFIASKSLQLSKVLLNDTEVTGRQMPLLETHQPESMPLFETYQPASMPLLETYQPTKLTMEIPVRPPRLHGG